MTTKPIAEFANCDADNLNAMTTPTVESLWKGYQIGQGSADHTAKEVFAEVIGPVLRELAAAQAELAAMKHDMERLMATVAECEQRAEAAERERDAWKRKAEENARDSERLDWFHARAFTAYRSRDPENKGLSGHVTLVNEDAKGSRTGITASTIRAAIDDAMAAWSKSCQ